MDENSDLKKCPHCAELIKTEAMKCKYCGEVLGRVAQAPGGRTKIQKRSSTGVIVLACIFVALVGVFLLRDVPFSFFSSRMSIEDLKAKAQELIMKNAKEKNIKAIRDVQLVHKDGNLYEGYANVVMVDPDWGTDQEVQLDLELIYDKESVMLKFKGVKMP